MLDCSVPNWWHGFGMFKSFGLTEGKCITHMGIEISKPPAISSVFLLLPALSLSSQLVINYSTCYFPDTTLSPSKSFYKLPLLW